MANASKNYLATEVISEQRIVSYRTLSRALKVHVNVAKCMLYEFYEYENKKNSGSIYATYILSGVKKASQPENTNGHANGDEDGPMPPSSPPPFTSSMPDRSQEEIGSDQIEKFTVPVTTITLVREELLESTKAQYEKITSIHLYSLSPHRIQDLVTLTDLGRGIFANTFVKEDPLIYNKTYGIIQNPDVRRRKGGRPIIEAAAPKFKAVKEDSKPAAVHQKVGMDTETGAVDPTSKKESSASDNISKSLAKSSSAKREKSDLFKSFAKTGSKPKLNREDTSTSASGTEDTKMTDADEEGESEDEALFLDTNTKKGPTSRKRLSDARKEREDKAAKLRKMMEDDDEEGAVPNVEDAGGVKAGAPVVKDSDNDEQMADGNEDAAWSESDTEKDRKTAPGKDNSAKQDEGNVKTEPKRRRGKRKVMKKKTMKDEDGYLVTKEEAVWESFSEDEPESERLNPSFPTSSAKGSTQTKSTAGKSSVKPAGSGKGGGIMNFFGKK
jgi:DNA polymerase delta subunit 3